MRFTAEDAFDASDAGEPIMLSAADVADIVEAHDAAGEDFFSETPRQPGQREWNAADVLSWLGY